MSTITVTSHERRDVSFTFLGVNNKVNIKVPHYWPFVRGIHRWPVDSHNRGPVLRKMLPYHDDFAGFNSISVFLYWYEVYPWHPWSIFEIWKHVSNQRPTAGIQSSGDSVPETLGSKPAFSRWRQLVSFRFDITSLMPVHQHQHQQKYIRNIYLTVTAKINSLWSGASVKWAIMGSWNALSSARCQVIAWTIAEFFAIDPLRTNFNEFIITTNDISFTKIHLRLSLKKCLQFCLDLNELKGPRQEIYIVNFGSLT